MNNTSTNQWLFAPCLAFALCLASAVPVRAELPRGDYDNDGVADLAVAQVSRAGLAGTTGYAVRGSAFGILYWVFNTPIDAFAPGRFFQNWGTVPAGVLVTSTTQPLLWTIKTPQLTDITLRYGIPGDYIVNLIDWDGDSLDDFLVVRRGPANEYGDGKTYFHWYSALSNFGGGIVDTVFGLPGDKLFTYYDEGRPRFGMVRVSTAGECQGQLEWYTMNFSTDPAQRRLGHRCWGLPGDIPLIPADWNSNGKADWMIVRPQGGIQVAYVLFDDEVEWRAVPLGRDTAIPQFGNIRGEGNTFAWSQRDYGAVGIRRANNSDEIISWGAPSNVIIRPDGTVVQPNSSDTLGGGGGGGGGGTYSCTEQLDFPDGPGGERVNANNSRRALKILFHKSMYGDIQDVKSFIYETGEFFDDFHSMGREHDGRPWWNSDKNINAYSSDTPVMVVAYLRDGGQACLYVENPRVTRE